PFSSRWTVIGCSTFRRQPRSSRPSSGATTSTTPSTASSPTRPGRAEPPDGLQRGARGDDDRRVGRRLEGIPGFGIDRVAEAAGSDPNVLRLGNYDTDIPPHPAAVEATRAAVGLDQADSYLPFSGLHGMKEAVAGLVSPPGGPA